MFRNRCVALFVVALMASACEGTVRSASGEAGKPASEGDLELIADTADASRAEESVRTFARMEIRPPPELPDGQLMAMEGEGVVDFDPPMAKMTMTASGGEVPEDQGEQVFVVTGSATYVHDPGMAERVGAPGKWLKESPKGGDPDSLAIPLIAPMTDPGRDLDMLGEARDVEVLGTDSVRGVETTHYRGTLDWPSAGESAKEAGVEDVSDPRFELWLDEEGRPARFTFQMKVASHVVWGTVVTSYEFYDWGAPVDIEVPPAEDTVDMPEPDLPRPVPRTSEERLCGAAEHFAAAANSADVQRDDEEGQRNEDMLRRAVQTLWRRSLRVLGAELPGGPAKSAVRTLATTTPLTEDWPPRHVDAFNDLAGLLEQLCDVSVSRR